MQVSIEPFAIAAARQVDLLPLAERYTQLKRVAATAGGEYAGPCPVCGGRDRFRVQPQANRWLCRRCTEGKWQDAIALYRAIHGAGFAEAVSALAGGSLPPARSKLPAAPEPARAGPPNAAWQARARTCVLEAEGELWSQRGQRARAWLNARGLADETLKRWHIGFIPSPKWERPADWGLEGKAVFVERGILIPAIAGGAIWYLKVRRAAGEPKYTQVRGGLPALFLADTLLSAREACITEGEFDALLLWQCLQHASNPRWRDLGVATLGSQSNRLSLDAWARYLYHLKHILVMYDQDGHSGTGAAHWKAIAGRAFPLRWQNIRPGDKDLTDFHLSGGRLLDLASWGILQAEQNQWPELPEVVVDFLAEVGLSVLNITSETNGVYHVSVGKRTDLQVPSLFKETDRSA
jgi:DNA primase